MVRLLVKGDDEIGSSLIDAEIAGRRTPVSHRPEPFVNRVEFRTDGVELANVRIADLAIDS